MTTFTTSMHRSVHPAPETPRPHRTLHAVRQWLAAAWQMLRGRGDARSRSREQHDMPCYYVE